MGLFLPCGNDCVLGPEAVDGAILHAQCDHTSAFAILHQQIQRKVLHKVAGVIPQRLGKNRAHVNMSFYKPGA